MTDHGATTIPWSEKSGPVSIPDVFVRFTFVQRAEHLLVMILFTMLVVTGLPQKFYQTVWAEWMIRSLGGIDLVRWLHRSCGVLFAVLAVWHLGRAALEIIRKRAIPSILPRVKDFRDVVVTLRYYLGVSEHQARFDRYDFRQKFEYIGLVVGVVVMTVTGFLLMYPVFFTSFLPGIIIPAAKTAHSYEAFMAFLVIIIWHMYGAHFSPEIFPGDTTIFTGKISRERMEKEHPLEYERVVKAILPLESPESGPQHEGGEFSEAPASGADKTLKSPWNL